MTVKTVPLLEALADISAGNRKIPASAFLATGALAVVDQGKELIGGWTNDCRSRVCTSDPLIVFGDHTRNVKYIDFPFAIGADGVKVLRPERDFDARYLYHFLASQKLPDAGYSRHFKFLKEVKVPKPPLEEQRRIAAILDRSDALSTKRRQVLKKLDSLKTSLYEDHFGLTDDSVRNSAEFPLSEWVDPLRPITYGILKPGPDTPDGVPYIRVADMKAGRVRSHTVRRTTMEIHSAYRRSTIRSGDLLMSIRGHVGRFVTIPPEFDGGNITQDSARLAIRNPDLAVYVRATLESPRLQAWMAARTKGAAVRGINLGDLRNAPIPEADAKQIANFAVVFRKIEAQETQCALQRMHMDAAFMSLRARAFRGNL